MTPHLLPVRVSACVFDPDTVPRTGEAVVDGVPQKKPHDWSFGEPDYDGVVKQRGPVWTGLFATRKLPPAITGTRTPAICLSWALPAGWGQPQRADDAHSHPALPDRWLVVRVVRRTHDGADWAAPTLAPAVKAWVVDAGVVRDASGAPVLVPEDGKLVARRVGRVRTLDEALTADADERRERLTAEGAASSRDLTFTAYVPAHLNNLACVDRLDDLPAGFTLADAALSYFVVGWYRQPERDDPLTRLRGTRVEDVRAALGLVDPDGADGKPSATRSLTLGERSVFHGVVAYVDYFNPRSYLGPAFGAPHPREYVRKHPCESAIYPDRLQIGVGMTAEAALAELCANRDDSVADGSGARMAEVLAALLDGSLPSWDAVGAEDLKVHARRLASFQTVASGKQWSVGPADPAAVEKETPPLGADLQGLLARLNDAQARADRKSWDLASAAETLYTMTWLAQAQVGSAAALQSHLAARASATRALHDEHRTLVATAAEQHTRLTAALDAAFAAGKLPVKFTVLGHDTPPFYVPREPAVAVRNISPRLPLRPLPRVGRSKEQLATDAPRDDQPFRYARLARAPIAGALKPGLGDADLDAVLTGLAGEAALIEEAVAALVRDRTTVVACSERTNLDVWMERGRRLFGDLGGAAVWPEVRTRPPTLDGSSRVHLPTAGTATVPLADLCTLWMQQPWLPLFLDWEVEWLPTPSATTSSPSTLTGRTLLANRPQRVLLDLIDRVGKTVMTHDPGVHAILNSAAFRDIGQWDVVGQTLSGLHQQLLTRHDLLPRTAPARDATPLGRCADLLQATALGPPQSSPNAPFQWFRSGSLRIRQLRVVDLFGQALVLQTAVVSGEQKTTADQVTLADRVLEPTRLAVTRPEVCGWLVPSRLDPAVVVYDRVGAPLGVITREAAGARLRPLLHRQPVEIADAALAAFVKSLTDPTAFDRFIELADEALARTLPARAEADAAPAALVGRPLALVRASLALERRGGPIVDASWLTTTYTFNKFAKDETAFIQSRRDPPRTIPVSVGCRHLPDDGLIGYQIAGGPIERTLKLGGKPTPISLALPGAGPAAAQEVTFLLDPHGKVYLDPGVLPVTAFSLPPDMFEAVRARLPAVLRLDSVLVDSHADLRAYVGADAPVRPRLDLPVPLGTRSPPAAGAPGPAGPAQPPARLSIDGALVDVDPASPAAAVPTSEVAAVAAMLIL